LSVWWGVFCFSRTTVRAEWSIPCFLRIHRMDRICRIHRMSRIFQRVVGRSLLCADHSPHWVGRRVTLRNETSVRIRKCLVPYNPEQYDKENRSQ
jgi:hypothetical protein